MTIKAIETIYTSTRFRSRLESRYAVLFDALGIPWEYEAEGYFVNRQGYLPDFWLPGVGYHAEVKPKHVAIPDNVQAKLRTFNANPPSGSKGLILLVGTPARTTHGIKELCKHAGIRNGRLIDDAIATARGAQFEHGKTPVIARRTTERPGLFTRMLRALIYTPEGSKG
jgi:hypothetical protein